MQICGARSLKSDGKLSALFVKLASLCDELTVVFCVQKRRGAATFITRAIKLERRIARKTRCHFVNYVECGEEYAKYFYALLRGRKKTRFSIVCSSANSPAIKKLTAKKGRAAQSLRQRTTFKIPVRGAEELEYACSLDACGASVSIDFPRGLHVGSDEWADFNRALCACFKKWAENGTSCVTLFRDVCYKAFGAHFGSCRFNSCFGSRLYCAEDGTLYLCNRGALASHPVGNLSQIDKIQDIFKCEQFLSVLKPVMERREECGRKCPLFVYCQSGCPERTVGEEQGNFALQCSFFRFAFNYVRAFVGKTLNAGEGLRNPVLNAVFCESSIASPDLPQSLKDLSKGADN